MVDFTEQDVTAEIERLRAIAGDSGQPPNLRRIAGSGADTLEAMLEAFRRGDSQGVREAWEGTTDLDGQPTHDGMRQVLPLWARGRQVLDALAGTVVVDDRVAPPRVTVHWERVPRHLRREAASLASELVDIYYPRPKGGRPRKDPRSKTG